MEQKDFYLPKKKGKKPELFLVLDCETATLPFVGKWELNANQKLACAMASPLIYDIGWKVIDRKLNVYSQHSFLVQETFFVPDVFNTAYYKDKRPIYMERYNAGEILAKRWNEIIPILQNDLQYVKYAAAYNAMFDFKKAIPYTERYIYNLYSSKYNDWEQKQKEKLWRIAQGEKPKNPKNFDPLHFRLRKVDYPMIDIWGIACEILINEDKYKKMCLENGMVSKSGLYFKTSAETSFRYLMKDIDFNEDHTAFEDTVIESEILAKALKKGTIKEGIQYFPFRNLGTTVDHVKQKKKKSGKPYYSVDVVDTLIDIIYGQLGTYVTEAPFVTTLEKKVINLETWKGKAYGADSVNKERFSVCYCNQLKKEINRLKTYQSGLVEEGKAWQRCQNQIHLLTQRYNKYVEYTK